MVRLGIVVAISLLARTAAAEPPPVPSEIASGDSCDPGPNTWTPPARSTLGMRYGITGLPFPHQHPDRRYAFSMGLELGRPFGHGFSGIVELDGVLLTQPHAGDVARDAHGYGARANLALRKRIGSALDLFYADVELGGGIGMISDSQAGRRVLPDGFVGLRAGYDLPWSRQFEAELLLRVVAVPDGIGVMFGVGFELD